MLGFNHGHDVVGGAVRIIEMMRPVRVIEFSWASQQQNGMLAMDVNDDAGSLNAPVVWTIASMLTYRGKAVRSTLS